MKKIKETKTMKIIKTIYLVFVVQAFSVSSIFADFADSTANTSDVSNVNSVGNTNDMINQAMVRHDQVLKDNKNQVEEYKAITGQRIKKVQEIQDYQRLINSIQKQSGDVNRKNTIKVAPQTIVFVSFSMPLLSLQQIVQDASRYRIPVVMRGLYNNSFKDTAAKIFEVVKEKNQGGILIDPIWFKKFDIKSVPALVINKNDKFDVIYGNISLKQALGIIAEKSESREISEIAKEILKEG